MKYFDQISATNYPDQITLGFEMADGLDKDGAALGITQVNAVEMRTKTGALEQTNDAFNNSRAAQEIAYDNFHDADKALDSWMGKVTGSLGAFFGKRWNRQWAPIGFIRQSIRIPDAVADRITVSNSMIKFLSGNPDKEAANQGVTAANGTTVRQAVLTTQKLATESDDKVKNNGTDRVTASADLTSYMRTLIGILAEALEPDDTRWHDFGLEIPASLTTPGAPSGLLIGTSTTPSAAAAADANMVSLVLNWNATPFATRYRLRRRFVGLVGADWELVASVTEPMAQVDVPANATVEFIVQAVNEDRQSVASEVVVYGPALDAAMAPVTIPAAALPAEVQTPAPSTSTAANGSNGHAHGRVSRK